MVARRRGNSEGGDKRNVWALRLRTPREYRRVPHSPTDKHQEQRCEFIFRNERSPPGCRFFLGDSAKYERQQGSGPRDFAHWVSKCSQAMSLFLRSGMGSRKLSLQQLSCGTFGNVFNNLNGLGALVIGEF